GGARAFGHYSETLFKKQYKDLTEAEKKVVAAVQLHDRTWRNDTSPGIMASFATGSTPCLKRLEVDANAACFPVLCTSCFLLFTSKAYQVAIHKKPADPENLRFVPHIHQNAHAGMLYTKFKGLEALILEVR
ncbi:hypothetical protein B0H10DRAFT_1638363, partial [Mycena sp. CBHHK59/15]